MANIGQDVLKILLLIWLFTLVNACRPSFIQTEDAKLRKTIETESMLNIEMPSFEVERYLEHTSDIRHLSSHDCNEYQYSIHYMMPDILLKLPDSETMLVSRNDINDFLSHRGMIAIEHKYTSATQLIRDKKTLICENDNNERCILIAKAIMHDRPSFEDYYIACRVVKNGEVIGAPQECEFVEIFIPQWGKSPLHLLRVGAPRSVSRCHSNGRADHRVTLAQSEEIPDEIPKSYLVEKWLSEISSLLANKLQQEPLSLKVETRQRGIGETLEAVASFRLSPILPGAWREMVTVRLDIDAESQHKKNKKSKIKLLIEVTTTLYVSKVNSSHPLDWHMATEQQNMQYKDFIVNLIVETIQKVCKHNNTNTILSHTNIECNR